MNAEAKVSSLKKKPVTTINSILELKTQMKSRITLPKLDDKLSNFFQKNNFR